MGALDLIFGGSQQIPGFCLVQDALMTILNKEEVAPRTSLALSMSEPYSPRSAQAHLARVQELLSAPSPQDALREGRSQSVLNTLTHTADASSSHLSKGKKNKTEQTSETPSPPDYIVPGATERPPLATLLPNSTYSERTVRCICVVWCIGQNLEYHITLEGWNSFLILRGSSSSVVKDVELLIGRLPVQIPPPPSFYFWAFTIMAFMADALIQSNLRYSEFYSEQLKSGSLMVLGFKLTTF
ncbi:clustered mitochondria protein-like [Silurus asotus]|uniref:Clustered mitochondria protein-like n=1 Tax=Silurus asotus TaxID=30991 RepID=A0AAD5AY59_SILAS|nr:clustered mitochondria protein-like [Silurus asotus]